MNRAYTARTYAELIALTADLPAGAMPVVYPMAVYQPPVTTNPLARYRLRILSAADAFSPGGRYRADMIGRACWGTAQGPAINRGEKGQCPRTTPPERPRRPPSSRRPRRSSSRSRGRLRSPG